MKSYAYMIIFLIFSNKLYAHDFSSRKVFLAGSLKGGYTTAASEDKSTIQSRKLASYSAEAMMGARLYHTIWGISGEYSLVRQLTDPASVSNTNVQGKLLAIAPLFGLEYKSFKLLFKFPKLISGQYTLDKRNSINQEVIYKDSKIEAVQLHWMKSTETFLGVEYQKFTYKKLNVAGVESSLSSSAYLNLITVSLMYGFTY